MGYEPKLSRLRDIAWSMWDPIGLTAIEGGWDGSSAADEYDCYLLETVGLIRQGATDDACVRYLTHVEAGNMGLGHRDDASLRASQAVRAIRAYLSTLPDEPVRRIE